MDQVNIGASILFQHVYIINTYIHNINLILNPPPHHVYATIAFISFRCEFFVSLLILAFWVLFSKYNFYEFSKYIVQYIYVQ